MTARTIPTCDTWRGSREAAKWLTDRRRDWWSIINVAMAMAMPATVARTQRWWHDKIFSQATLFDSSLLRLPAVVPLASALRHRFGITFKRRKLLLTLMAMPAATATPTATFALLPYDLYAIAFCGNVSSMSAETHATCVCTCGNWALHTTASTLLACIPPSASCCSHPFSFIAFSPLTFSHFIVDSIIFYSHASAIFGIFNLFRNFWTLYEYK